MRLWAFCPAGELAVSSTALTFRLVIVTLKQIARTFSSRADFESRAGTSRAPRPERAEHAQHSHTDHIRTNSRASRRLNAHQ